ncbi:MAG: hypothetical protein B7Y19_01905, partial [Sphingobacteriales bacterium 24-40-4]
MKISSVQFKAAFLLIVFSLSTIVGFACSVGLDMTFNADHHKETAGQQQKSHEHAASADHHQEPVSHHEHPADHHQKKADHHKQVSNLQENPEDDCCKDEVAKFEKSDKRTPQSFNYNLRPLFVT